MEEINYYGGSSSKENVIYGALAKTWANVNSKRDIFHSNGVGLPFVYYLDKSEIADLTNTSFTFPIRVWISHDEDVIYSKPFFIKTAKEFHNLAETAPDNSTFIVTLAPVKFDDWEMYAAKDGVIFRVDGGNNKEFFPVSFNLTHFWEKCDFSDNLVIRFRYPGSGKWVVDGFVDRNNEHVNAMFGTHAEAVSDEAMESYYNGFYQGFNDELNHFAGHLVKAYERLRLASDYNISSLSSVAKYQGYCLGQLLQATLGISLENGKNLSAIEKAIKLSQNNNSAKIITGVSLHNALVTKDRPAVRQHLRNFFACDKSGAISSLVHFYNYGGCSLPHFKTPSSGFENYSDIIPELDKFEVFETLSFENGQFRILKEEMNPNSDLRIRFQSTALQGVKTIILENGEEYIISKWTEKVEVTFEVPNVSEERKAKLFDLNYDLGSQAGTKAKYAPCKIENGKLLSVEGDIEIASIDLLTKDLVNYFLHNSTLIKVK